MKTRKKNLLCGVVSLLAIFAFVNINGCTQGTVAKEVQVTEEIQYRQISLEDYKDKVAGGWLVRLLVCFGRNIQKVYGKGK